jgi:O-antigen/teichoic acid export membrane protein
VLSAPDRAELERGRKRIRRVVATSGSALVARGVRFASVLVLVPLTVPYLGAQRYGIWMTLLSLVAMLGMMNLGVSSALVTLIARAQAAGDQEEAGRYISTATVLFAAVAVALGIVATLALPLVSWEAVFNLPAGPLVDEGGRAALILVIVFLVAFPAGAVAQIRLGLQEGYVTAWFDAVGSAVGVAGVALAVALGAGLPWLVAAAAAAPLVAALANWTLLVRSRPALKPRVRRADRRYVGVLLRRGALFFGLQLMFVVGFSSDNFVAAQILGPAAVTQYAVPSSLLLAGLSLVSAVQLPLWGAYADALAVRDARWVLRTLRRSLILTGGVACLGGVAFVAAGGWFVEVWSRGEVVPGTSLLLGLGLWLILASLGITLGMLLNAAHAVRIQLICGGLMAAANITLSILLARRIGVAGLIWGTVVSYATFVLIPYAFLVPRLLDRLRGA